MPRGILISKRLISVLAILILNGLAASLYLIYIPQNTSATKLLIVSSTSFLPLEKPVELTIKAIDDKGTLDTTRNDVVELSIKSISYYKPMAKLSSHRIELSNGIGSTYIEGEIAEVVDVTAVWKKGNSMLESSTIHLFIGIGEE